MVTGLLKGKNYCKEILICFYVTCNLLLLAHLIKPWLYRNNVQLGYFLAALTGIYKVRS